MAKSTARRRTTKAKPEKPYDGFPMFPHATGRWAKKIRGKLHYFGRIAEDPEGVKALAKLNRELPFLKDGRTPPPIDAGDALTMRKLCNDFLNSKRLRLASGELAGRSFADYKRTTDRLIATFGKDRRVDDLRPDDFDRLRLSMATSWSPKTVQGEVTRVRVVFKYAYDQRLIDRPIHFGQSFNLPSKKVLRKARNEAGEKLFTAVEIARILHEADTQLRAMILLGLNCGFGNMDCATLPQSAVDLQKGWIEFPRPKTAVKRRIPLWKETVKALAEAALTRPAAKNPADDGRVFLTTHGTPWVKVTRSKKDPETFVRTDQLTVRFRELLASLKINGRRGLGFYTLRHNFETWGGESKDQIAVDAIMGHADPSMGAEYRERISDDRLRAVVAAVHGLAFPSKSRKVK